MKRLLTALLLLASAQTVRAEIQNYVLDKIEIISGQGGSSNIRFEPILSGDKKATTVNLMLAGLGTARVTAQCPVYALAKETQIFPMKEPYRANKSLTSGAEWYYVAHDQGVTIIEISGKSVKLHNLGMVPYTYVGRSR